RVIGRGGMGAVYEAKHVSTGRSVAIKTIRADKAQTADGQGSALDRFRREAHVMGSVDSPHVVSIIDAGEDPESGQLFRAMELLAGEDLEGTLKRAPILHPQAAVRIAIQALEGLVSAHAASVVHRDLKPPNLFLAQRPGGEVVVKVVDFGIAR